MKDEEIMKKVTKDVDGSWEYKFVIKRAIRLAKKSVIEDEILECSSKEILNKTYNLNFDVCAKQHPKDKDYWCVNCIIKEKLKKKHGVE